MISQLLFTGILIDGVLGYQMRLASPKSFTHKRNLLSSPENPCTSITEIPTEQLTWPYEGTPPWNAEPNTKTYNSTVVTASINILRSEIVPRLSTTFEQTFKVFQDAGCLLYIHGGGVRDYLLGLSPKDIDIEYSCNPNILESTCVQSFGSESCHIFGSYFYVGEASPTSAFEVLEGVNWNGTIFAPAFTKEYTTNALSYDLNGNDIIIDIVGSGTNDTCSRFIRIPVPESDWWKWMTESEYFSNNGIAKLPRFWKLSSTPKSYSPADEDTLSFITTNIKQLWGNTTYPIETTFRKFYCNMVSGKVATDGSGCHVENPLNSDISTKLNAYNIAIENDMGSQWYNEFIVNDNVNKIIVDIESNDATTLEIGLLSFCAVGIGLAINLFEL